MFSIPYVSTLLVPLPMSQLALNGSVPAWAARVGHGAVLLAWNYNQADALDNSFALPELYGVVDQGRLMREVDEGADSP